MGDVPTRTAYDVCSEQTGALVIADVPEPVAQAEAERLNAEAARPVGEVPVDDDRTLHAGEQLGRGPTRYVVDSREVVDEQAHAEQLEADVAEVRAQLVDVDEAERVQVSRGADVAEAQAERLTERGAEHAETFRAALEGLDA